MFALNLTLDTRDERRLSLLAQVSKLKAAQTLTFTAERVIPVWRAANHHVFHMRSNWIDKGVRMRAATPGNLVAQVGSIDRYMARHTVGLEMPKEASEGGNLIVPLMPAAQQGTHTQFRRQLRGFDQSSRKTFLMHANGKTFIVRRQGKSARGLDFLAEVMPSVKIPHHLDALALTAGVVFKEFGPVYSRLLLSWAENGR